MIKVDNDIGVVQHISLKSTRIRTLDGPLLVLPNKKIMDSAVNNYFAIQRRRVTMKLGVLYETTPDVLESIPDMLRSIVQEQDNKADVSFQFEWAVFAGYGPSSLDFELVYYITSNDYADFLLQRQKVNYAIFRSFADKGIGFAYPTHTIHMAKDSG